MEAAVLLTTFACGLLFSRIGLPPMIGYLIAGFALFSFGLDLQQLSIIEHIAEIGITLLLFAIGLKLDIKSLLQKEIWAGASLTFSASILVTLGLLKCMAWIGLTAIEGLNLNQLLLISFALSFSSTVFAVKTLEDKGDMAALYGQIAIGILIMQDIFAVIYMTASKGQWPSIYALGLLLLPLARPLLYRILDKVGHGELLVLFGLFSAFVLGAWLFEQLGVKPDLGALFLGVLLAPHPKANELAKSLLSLKELLLIGFFLTIGLSGLPTLSDLYLGLILLLLLPIKFIVFYLTNYWFGFRGRTSLMTGLALTNFSEFGLIVISIAIAAGSLPSQFATAIAISLSISFIISSPLNILNEQLYQKFAKFFSTAQKSTLHPLDIPLQIGTHKCLVLGMGRVGAGAYDELKKFYDDDILGIDHKIELVEQHQQQGRNVICGDASDKDFWDQLCHHSSQLVLLAMPHHMGNIFALEQLRASGYLGQVAAIARFEDEAKQLKELGADNIYNLYQAAGAGFAENFIKKQPRPQTR
ncbi:cation:proton antiporter family protein [Paraferrimonas sp. SM1919]|uniref:cation:proton antiporter family protein n=1 Tax=Paraferrimonas sp. SM1919 TaxID=2662263 RepID=UPI0013D8569E|nr:cation:proton antiporter family protein [Paraferrimonas sp. SM1919]